MNRILISKSLHKAQSANIRPNQKECETVRYFTGNTCFRVKFFVSSQGERTQGGGAAFLPLNP